MFSSIDGNPFKATNTEKYLIVDRLKQEYNVRYLCNLLSITTQSYYKWVRNGKKPINNFDINIARLILIEHYEQKEVYGTLRLKKHIENKYGIIMNHKKIRRYKKYIGLEVVVRKLKPIHQRNFRHTTLQKYMAKNILKCNFKSNNPLEKLSTDVSYIQCTDGLLYLSAVKDLFNNQIIAHNISECNDANLVCDTIKQLPNSKAKAIIHSDQGSAYYSYKYIELLEKKGYIRSMSRRGACWENSPIENWFSQLKEEELRRVGKKTKRETRKIIKKYVHWYNNERIQKDLNYLSPIQFLNCA